MKKLLAVLLSVAMIIGLCAVTVSAATDNTPTATVKYTIKVVWEDNDYPGRPASVTPVLFDNAKIYQTELNSGNSWTGVQNVPKYADDGSEITYNIYVPDLADYTSQCLTETDQGSGEKTITITYTLDQQPAPVTNIVFIVKSWANVPEGTALPSYVNVDLYAKGPNDTDPVKVHTVTLRANDNWENNWRQEIDLETILPNSENYEWSCVETTTLNGYDVNYSSSGADWRVTNTYNGTAVVPPSSSGGFPWPPLWNDPNRPIIPVLPMNPAPSGSSTPENSTPGSSADGTDGGSAVPSNPSMGAEKFVMPVVAAASLFAAAAAWSIIERKKK